MFRKHYFQSIIKAQKGSHVVEVILQNEAYNIFSDKYKLRQELYRKNKELPQVVMPCIIYKPLNSQCYIAKAKLQSHERIKSSCVFSSFDEVPHFKGWLTTSNEIIDCYYAYKLYYKGTDKEGRREELGYEHLTEEHISKISLRYF